MTHIDKQHIDYTLYLVTDRSVMSAKSLEQAVEQAIQGGCTVAQLREKHTSSREFFVRVKSGKWMARRLVD